MQATKIAAPEGAAHENNPRDHDTMSRAVVQAVADFKAGLESLRQLVNVIGVQCFIGGYATVQVGTAQNLEHVPGELRVSRRDSEEYPWELTKTVGGIDFIALAKEDPNATYR
jgi:hypothetical protein